jgi:demethylmenaquinone methyltransferase/2-methoxy-6-polyprenyl-1,4-benzoquinol methylase
VPVENSATQTPARSPIKALPRYFADEPGRRVFLNDLFDRTAHDYDFIERLLALGSGAWYRRSALRRAGLAAGMKVLDVATGTGLVAREALAIVGPTGGVIGLDPSEGMLGEAQQLHIPLVRALGEHIPFPDATFDFVSMGFALRHVAHLETLFSEIRRVLKPGGIACVLEITRPRRKRVEVPLRFFMTRIVPVVARVTRGKSDAAHLMQFYWDTIEACVPPHTVLAALSRSGMMAPSRTTIRGMFSEYVAKTATS